LWPGSKQERIRSFIKILEEKIIPITVSLLPTVNYWFTFFLTIWWAVDTTIKTDKIKKKKNLDLVKSLKLIPEDQKTYTGVYRFEIEVFSRISYIPVP
jgi:hypothetical protein